MPRNQGFDNKTSNDIYGDISKGKIKKNLTQSLKRTRKKTFFSRMSGLLFKLFVTGLILGLSLTAGAAFAIWSFSSKLPDISKIQEYTPSETSEIYDVNGRLLAKLHDEENRTIVPLKEIPLTVQQAVLSMEDERFYQHFGIDPKGMARMAASFFDKSLVKGGASTITQQLARNLFLTPEVKVTRKIAEWILAVKIENKFPKSKILELYLNQVYWGHNSYGVEAASRTFFGKSVRELNLAEASLIGGLLSSPEYYSPHRDLKIAKWRQSLTLENMIKLGFIKKAQAEEAKKYPIKLVNVKRTYKLAHPYFTSYVISVLRDKYGDSLLRKGGLKVYTTMDPDSQSYAEDLIKEQIGRYKISNNVGQGALVSIDPNTGFIKAIVGGTNYEKSQFNRATQAKRQPGSSFKPFVYLTAFKEGMITPYSGDVDAPITYPDMGGSWSPKNYDGTYRGPLQIIDAIRKSVNTVAVKTLDRVGIDKVIETARILGIESYLGPNLSLALGSSEVTPLELASAYGVFATGGKKPLQITPILKIEDRNGDIIEDYQNQETEQVYSHRAIDMLNIGLKAVVTSGSGSGAYIPGRVVAGKTGTTSDHKDSWFAGYTPQLVTVVWIGNDDNSRMWGTTGGGFCAPIWKKYMVKALKGLPSTDFPKAGPKDPPIVASKNFKGISGIQQEYKVDKKDSEKKPEESAEPSNPQSDLNTVNSTDNTSSEDKRSQTNTNLDSTVPQTIEGNNESNPDTGSVNNRRIVPDETKVEETKPIYNKPPRPEPTAIQIYIPPKKENKPAPVRKTDEEVNKAVEDLKSVKELYDSR
jgi:penicillin-binding protein 1A